MAKHQPRVGRSAVHVNLRRKTPSPRYPKRARSRRDELETRLDAVEAFLAQRFPRSEIIAECRRCWGVSTRQADRYLRDAGERWRTRVEPARDEDRRRNIATLDLGIAACFREGRYRELASLVQLRGRFDRSLANVIEQFPAGDGRGFMPPPQMTGAEFLAELATMKMQIAEYEKLQTELAAQTEGGSAETDGKRQDP